VKEESTHESGEVILGASRTELADNRLRHRVAGEEVRDGGQTEAEVKVSRVDVLAYRNGGKLDSMDDNTCTTPHTVGSDLDVRI
jgi:hypothetical protein